MKAVLQRVRQASVHVDGQISAQIASGILVLLGIDREDTEAQATLLARKTAQLRLFEDAEGKMNLSALDGNKALLVVSQFTLCADLQKGRRPSFAKACPPALAKPLYACFCRQLRQYGLSVSEGIFQADMQVHLVNDGPVTFCLDSALWGG
ncbi:MAG: D-aminoacyl-tRNA deacylase [Proteobacteria bacterium]|nr:D-aminoacyl-tRNA deacylase [Cystobacterineae bacterium]MCL2258397.1 D-aminoacyl-tRNA deacylase [Cystobacterineae bacterium]MCL2315091.1 D-aminoacyl-tRNA deacylase [Pseudomonadota bacterium]